MQAGNGLREHLLIRAEGIRFYGVWHPLLTRRLAAF
jgi:hypothetical protein